MLYSKWKKKKKNCDWKNWVCIVVLSTMLQPILCFWCIFLCSGDSESEEDDEIMDADAAKQDDTVAHALAAADALGKTPKNSGTSFLDITDGLKELDMDHYDDEDDGISISKTLCWGCF